MKAKVNGKAWAGYTYCGGGLFGEGVCLAFYGKLSPMTTSTENCCRSVQNVGRTWENSPAGATVSPTIPPMPAIARVPTLNLQFHQTTTNSRSAFDGQKVRERIG